MMPETVLVTGGVKSGKSAWALARGERLGERRVFVATATALDEEMRAKISAHQEERGARWQTREEPRNLPEAIEAAAAEADVVLVDCITLWVSNLLTLYALTPAEIVCEREKLCAALEAARAHILLVTNEVGLGIMPADSLSRRYQNLLGEVNRDIARWAGGVYVMVAGIAQRLK
jgi:adenosylcobinamide kinase / adenosylcobinamide-phosphate guanylyltransferase